MTSYRIDYDTNWMVAHRLPPPGDPETWKWYVEIPGMAEWISRVVGAYRWCAKCLVVRPSKEHEEHLVIHDPDYWGKYSGD